MSGVAGYRPDARGAPLECKQRVRVKGNALEALKPHIGEALDAGYPGSPL
jgi:hypothetical protein